MKNKILTYDSVEISFSGKAVVHDVNFSLEPGEILGLVGESGSGKSTLIKAAIGLLGSDGLVTRGDIRYMGENILDIPEKEKRKIRGRGTLKNGNFIAFNCGFIYAELCYGKILRNMSVLGSFQKVGNGSRNGYGGYFCNGCCVRRDISCK